MPENDRPNPEEADTTDLHLHKIDNTEEPRDENLEDTPSTMEMEDNVVISQPISLESLTQEELLQILGQEATSEEAEAIVNYLALIQAGEKADTIVANGRAAAAEVLKDIHALDQTNSSKAIRKAKRKDLWTALLAVFTTKMLGSRAAKLDDSVSDKITKIGTPFGGEILGKLIQTFGSELPNELQETMIELAGLSLIEIGQSFDLSKQVAGLEADHLVINAREAEVLQRKSILNAMLDKVLTFMGEMHHKDSSRGEKFFAHLMLGASVLAINPNSALKKAVNKFVSADIKMIEKEAKKLGTTQVEVLKVAQRIDQMPKNRRIEIHNSAVLDAVMHLLSQNKLVELGESRNECPKEQAIQERAGKGFAAEQYEAIAQKYNLPSLINT